MFTGTVSLNLTFRTIWKERGISPDGALMRSSTFLAKARSGEGLDCALSAPSTRAHEAHKISVPKRPSGARNQSVDLTIFRIAA